MLRPSSGGITCWRLILVDPPEQCACSCSDEVFGPGMGGGGCFGLEIRRMGMMIIYYGRSFLGDLDAVVNGVGLRTLNGH
jgi:hypothetical protein